MFKDAITGDLYTGDMRNGDRPATSDELFVWTTNQNEEIKKALLASALPRRDTLLFHLQRFQVKAKEDLSAAVGAPAIEAAQAKVNAISAAVTSLENIFSDSRIVASVDGAARVAVQVVYLEIFQALYLASPATYAALKALDPV